MGIERNNLRAKCDSLCKLIGLDGVTYNVKLGDLSLGGARVEMEDKVSHGLHLGEMCGLVLRDDDMSSSTKLTGTIVRLESGTVGISFKSQEHQHQKKKYTPRS